jgi:hypothetical protein
MNLTLEVANDLFPTVAITSPSPGAVVSGLVTITADAADDHGINRVVFYVGSKYVGYDPKPPYALNFNSLNLPNGSYVITAKAYDSAGQMTISQGVNVSIEN